MSLLGCRDIHVSFLHGSFLSNMYSSIYMWKRQWSKLRTLFIPLWGNLRMSWEKERNTMWKKNRTCFDWPDLGSIIEAMEREHGDVDNFIQSLQHCRSWKITKFHEMEMSTFWVKRMKERKMFLTRARRCGQLHPKSSTLQVPVSYPELELSKLWTKKHGWYLNLIKKKRKMSTDMWTTSSKVFRTVGPVSINDNLI